MDTFPGLVIYVSLVALAKAPSLWQQLYNGGNLLFRRHDFYPPFRTKAWRFLAELEDAELHKLTGTLKACCEPNWVATKSMEETITEMKLITLSRNGG